jgi:hypothetical protein
MEIRDRRIADLEQALSKAKILNGVLPICASCKKIKNDSGNWQQIELYLRERAPVEFSHGICPECARLWFPEQDEQ